MSVSRVIGFLLINQLIVGCVCDETTKAALSPVTNQTLRATTSEEPYNWLPWAILGTIVGLAAIIGLIVFFVARAQRKKKMDGGATGSAVSKRQRTTELTQLDQTNRTAEGGLWMEDTKMGTMLTEGSGKSQAKGFCMPNKDQNSGFVCVPIKSMQANQSMQSKKG